VLPWPDDGGHSGRYRDRAMRRVLGAADLRELPLVVGLIAAALAEGHWSADAEGLSPQGVLAAIAIAVPLLWRHAAPQTVLALVVLGVFACMATLKPGWTVVAVSAVAIYSVALYGDRLRTLATAGCIIAVTVAVMTLFSDRGLLSSDALTRLGILLIALILGDAVRGRRAERAAAAEREAERERRARDEADRRLSDERLRIAQEVHDVVAHAMVAINVQAGVAAHVLHKRPGQAETALTEIKRVSGAALDDLRATLGVLRDDGAAAPVHPTRVLSEVPDLAAPLRAAGVRVDVALDGPEERVPSPVGAAAYRIVQEALTNVLRHADASSAAVRVAIGARSVEIDVRNDSVGSVTEPPANGAGSGLRGMSERAEALGGRIEAGRLPDGGWRVHAVLPLGSPPPPAPAPGAQPPGGGTPWA
jgi:signal transduction histidine kinase